MDTMDNPYETAKDDGISGASGTVPCAVPPDMTLLCIYIRKHMSHPIYLFIMR